MQQQSDELLQAKVEATRQWLVRVVIGLDLCPFAASVYHQGKLAIAAVEGDAKESLLAMLDYLQQMAEVKSPESVILVLSDHFSSFDFYLEFIDVAENTLADEGYEGVFQLASFHPDYCFADADENDPANWTNRSPYPLLHILREASVTRAIESHPVDTMEIPKRNQKMTRELGLDKMRELVAICKAAK